VPPEPPTPGDFSPNTAAEADAAQCFQPLSALKGLRFPTYEDYAEEARGFAVARNSAGRGCLSASVGTCGGLRFVLISDGYSYSANYFDAAGKLVAARMGSDVVSDGCDDGFHYGERLTCVEVTTTNYCAK